MIPNVVRTWAPQGKTPIHRHRKDSATRSRDLRNSVSPGRHRLGLYYLLFYDNIGQEEVCLYLRELLRVLRGPVILLLDNFIDAQGKGDRAVPRQTSPPAHRVLPGLCAATESRRRRLVIGQAGTGQQLPKGCGRIDGRHPWLHRRNSEITEKAARVHLPV